MIRLLIVRRFIRYEKGQHFSFSMKPILSLTSGLTAPHLVYLVSAHLDHQLNAFLTKQPLTELF